MAGSVDLGSVYATLDLKTNNFESGISSASSAMGGLQQTILGVFGGNLLFSAVNKATDLLIGFGKTAIQSSADFQTSMNVLQVVTGATATQMESLRKKAIDLGNDITLPAVSASDAADAMTELGKAGLGVNDVLAASKGVLQAAAAGNIGVAESANLVSSALLAFGLAGGESTRVADLLAAAANASNLELGQVGLGLQQVGAQAKIAGVPIEQTVGLLAQLANKGISAEQAGTSLSYMIRQLTAPTQKAKEVMSDLGLSVFDSNGKFVGMRETIIRLNKATEGMSQEQKAAALNTIFGAEAMKGAAAIMQDGVAGFDKMQAAVTKQGAAAELAGARTKGLNGIISAIQSQFETFALTIGDKVRPLLEKVGGFISDNFIPVITVLSAALLGGLAAALAVVTPAIISFTGALLTNPIFLIVTGIALLAAGLAYLQIKFDIFGKAWDFLGQKIQPFMPLLRAIGDFIKDNVVSAFNSLKSIFEQLGKALEPVINAFKEILANKTVQTVLKAIGIALLAIVAAPIVAFFATLLVALKALQIVLKFVADHFELIKKIVLIALAVAFAPLLLAIGAVIVVVKAVIAVIGFLVDAFNWVINTVQAIYNFFVAVWQAIYNAVIGPMTAIYNVIKFVVELIVNLFIIVFGSILIVILTVLNAIWDVITTVWNAIWGFLQPIIQGIVDFFKDRWENLKNNVMLVFNTLKDFFTTIWNAIYNTIKGIVQKIIDFFAPALSWLYEKGKAVIQGLIDGISHMASAVWNAIKGVADQIGNFFAGVGQWLFDSGKALFQGFINGMKAIGQKVQDTAKDIIQKVRNLLPFSPAKEGPFSGKGWTLYSGQALMKGFMQGIDSQKSALASSLAGTLGGVSSLLNSNMSVTASAVQPGVTGGLTVYGDVNIANKSDADYLLAKLSRRQDLTTDGLVGA